MTILADGEGVGFATSYPLRVPLTQKTRLAPSDVARAWGMTPANVTLMIRDGKLPAERDEETGRYTVLAKHLSMRPIVEEIDGPAAEADKVTAAEAAELKRRQAAIDKAEKALEDARQHRDAYIAYLADSQGEVRRDPIDVARYLPGDASRRAKQMHRSTVHRIVNEQRERLAKESHGDRA
jgi:hypothetical protein